MTSNRLGGMFLALILTLGFSACGDGGDRLGGGGDDPADIASFVYTANADDDTISGYIVRQDGTVEQITGGPFDSEGDNPIAMAISPDNDFLYVVNSGDGMLATFSIDEETGELDLVGEPLFVGSFNAPSSEVGANGISEINAQPISIAVHPDGEFLYVGAFETGELFGFSLDPTTGEPTEEYHEFIEAAVTAFAFDGEIMYTVDVFGSVYAFAIDPDHDLNEQGVDWEFITSFWLGTVLDEPYAANLVVSPEGRLYITAVDDACLDCDSAGRPQGVGANLTFDDYAPGYLVVLVLDGDAFDLVEFNSMDNPAFVGLTPDGIAMTPDGDFLYVAVAAQDESTDNDGGVLIFSVASETGELDFDDVVDLDQAPQAMVMDDTGSVLAVANLFEGHVNAFEIEDDGSLTEVEDSPFNVGNEPIAIVSTH